MTQSYVLNTCDTTCKSTLPTREPPKPLLVITETNIYEQGFCDH